MKKISKSEAKEQIEKFFLDIKGKSPKEIQTIKKFAMSHNIQLKELRKKFCKKCYSRNLKIKGIKNKIKTIECENCGNLMRWRLN